MKLKLENETPVRYGETHGGPWFNLRLAAGDWLYRLAARVTPKHRYNHRYSQDSDGGEIITIWREPA